MVQLGFQKRKTSGEKTHPWGENTPLGEPLELPEPEIAPGTLFRLGFQKRKTSEEKTHPWGENTALGELK